MDQVGGLRTVVRHLERASEISLAYRWHLHAGFAALLLILPSTIAQGQSLDCSCNNHEACIATGQLLSPFLGLPESSAGEAALKSNLERIEEIYLNSSPDEKAQAAIDSQLDPESVPVRNIWAIATPDLSEKFNDGALPNPGMNSPPHSYQTLIEDSLDNTGFIAGDLKDYFATANVYGEAYGALPGVTNPDPRPFQVSKEIADSPWTTAETEAFAVDIQQSMTPPAPFTDESWEGLSDSPAFPSGHSTGGNTVAIVSAMAAPQYYKDLVYAGTRFALSRNIFGAHYPLDVIGGRIIATYNVANVLNGTFDYPAAFTLDDLELAGADLQDYLGSGGESPYAAACEGNLAACIREGAIPSPETFEEEREDYRFLLTYDLPPVGPTDMDPVVPKGAEILLATRFPYLTQEQRRSVLATTQIPSGFALDDGSGWARLDLFSAADGFGAFDEDVAVTLDADKGGFHAFDVWANNITGTGGLTKHGSGTLVLAGNSSYSGGTEVKAGTLGVSGAIKGAVTVAEGAFFFNGGQVTAIGDSRVMSYGHLANEGRIRSDVMNSGELVNRGRIVGDVTNSGRLSGDGRIKGSLVSSGTVAPGNSIGRMEVEGPVTFETGSVFDIEIAADGRSDRLAASGPVTLNDVTLAVSVDDPSAIGLQSFSILTSDSGIKGSVGSLGDPFGSTLPFLDLAVSKDAGVLNLASVRSDVPFTSVAETPNQTAVAAALDSLPAEGALMDALVSLDGTTAPDAFSLLSGEIYGSAQTVLQTQSLFLRDAISGRQRQATTPDKAGGGPESGPQTAPLLAGLEATVWMQGYGAWGSTDGTANTSRLSRSVGGVVIGVDAKPHEDITLGLAGGYSRSSFDVDALSSSGNSDNYDLAAYAAGNLGSVTLRAGAAYAWHRVSVTRSARVSSYSETLNSDYDARTVQAFGEIGYGAELQHLFIEPFANIAYVNLQTDGFTEEGGAAALRGSDNTQANSFTTLGLRAASDLPLGDGRFLAEGSLGWQHSFGDLTPEAELAFASGGSTFSVSGAPLARDSAVVGATLGYRAAENLIFGLSYAGQLAGSARDNAVTGQVSVAF